jgi:hypothetical protein
MPYLNTGTKQYIKKSDSFNSLLTLSDNSQWKVGLFDKSTIILWSAMDDVVVGDGFLNKHKITHVKRKETIEVEFIQK